MVNPAMTVINVNWEDVGLCGECGSLVPGGFQQMHSDWHDRSTRTREMSTADGGDDVIDDRDGWRWLVHRLRDRHLIRTIQRMENEMATITDALNALAEQVGAVSQAQQAAFENLQAAVQELRQGNLSPEQEAQVAQIEQSLDQIRTEAEAADDAVEPATGGTEPMPGEPGGEPQQF